MNPALALAPGYDPEQDLPRRSFAQMRADLDGLGIRSGQTVFPLPPEPPEPPEEPKADDTPAVSLPFTCLPILDEIRRKLASFRQNPLPIPLDPPSSHESQSDGSLGSGKITSKCTTSKKRKPFKRSAHLHEPPNVWKCQTAKKKKKEDSAYKKRVDRKKLEAKTMASGGTVGAECKRGAHFCSSAKDVKRHSAFMTEINAQVAYFKNLLGLSPTTHLPPPGPPTIFRKGAEPLAWQFTLGQLLPSVNLEYVETSPDRYSEVACTWAGHLSYWERDFDITFTLPPVEEPLNGAFDIFFAQDQGKPKSQRLRYQLQCKGLRYWYRTLFNSLASTDYARATNSAPFLRFYRAFRRMAVFAIRAFVNQLQCQYQSPCTGPPPLPLLYLGYQSLKQWLAEGLRLDSADDLLSLYQGESNAFWTRFRKLFSRVFPREWQILEVTFLRTSERCRDRKEFYLLLSAEDIATMFANFLKAVKKEQGYEDDREECRALFNWWVKRVNELANAKGWQRKKALTRLLPRLTQPRKPRKMSRA